MESDHLKCSSPHENKKTTSEYFNDAGIVIPDTSAGDTVQATPNRNDRYPRRQKNTCTHDSEILENHSEFATVE